MYTIWYSSPSLQATALPGNVFLAALSSSRRLDVCPSVGRSVRRSVAPSVREVWEKVTFRVSNGNLNLPKTYLLMRH